MDRLPIRETSPEIAPNPQDIDRWVYENYSLSALSYFSTLDEAIFEQEDIPEFPKEIKIDPQSWKDMYIMMGDINPDSTTFSTVKESLIPFHADREPKFIDMFFTVLKEYPSFRRELFAWIRSGGLSSDEGANKKNDTKKILTPLELCIKVREKFKSTRYEAIIIPSESSMDAIILIRDKQARPRSIHIYDPLARFRKKHAPIGINEVPTNTRG